MSKIHLFLNQDWEGVTKGNILVLDSDDEQVAELLIKNIARHATDTEKQPAKSVSNDDIATQVKEAVQAELKASRTESTPALSVKVGKNRLEDDPKLGFKSFGDFNKQVRKYIRGNEIENKEGMAITKATGVSVGDDSSAGFLVPAEFANKIMERVHGEGQVLAAVRQYGTVLPMARNSIEVPFVDESSRANGSRAGGVYAYWTGEGSSPTVSTPGFGQNTLVAHKLVGYTAFTDEFLNDNAYAAEQFITAQYAREVTFRIEDAILNGSGSAQPLGIHNAPCLVTQSDSASNSAGELEFALLAAMFYGRLRPMSQQRAVWLVGPQIAALLPQLILGNTPIFLPHGLNPGAKNEIGIGSIFGRPVIVNEYMAALNSANAITVADFSGYLLGEKSTQPEVATSMHVLFLQGENAMRITMRVAGQPIYSSPVTEKDGSNTTSEFVTLGAVS